MGPMVFFALAMFTVTATVALTSSDAYGSGFTMGVIFGAVLGAVYVIFRVRRDLRR